MKHLETGTLRRALDEPVALLGSQRRHLADCAICQRRSTALAAQAEAAGLALGGASSLKFSTNEAPEMGGRAAGVAVPRKAVHRLPIMFWTASAAAILVVLFFVTPLRSFAAGFLAIFEPQRFVALPISRSDAEHMRALPNLSNYGTMHEISRQRQATAVDAAHAATLAQFPVRVPAFVPLGLPAPQYQVISRSAAAFTFNAAKAAAAAKTAGSSLPPMPPGLDGSTLEATVGPAVLALYVTPQQRASEQRARRSGQHRGGWPKLLVAQMPVPTIASSGVSATTLVGYLAAQPGLSPQIAAELRAVADPAATLPIPIPIDRMHAEPVMVQGARGLFVGDNTGVGAGVIWQSRGYVYGIAGTLPVRTILDVANSLH